MAEYQLLDFRKPELRGEEDRADLDDLEREFHAEAELGWRVVQIVGGLSEERLMVLFERLP